MKLQRHHEMILALLRCALNGGSLSCEFFSTCTEEDWARCFKLAKKQGVAAIAWDAIGNLPDEIRPSKALKLRWIMMVDGWSKLYMNYCDVASRLVELYEPYGIATVLLKGVGLSTYYPIPERRQGGDIDIYVYSRDHETLNDRQASERADELMRATGIEVVMNNYKHSNFVYSGVPVENHKFLLDVDSYEIAAQAEEILHRCLEPEKAVLANGREVQVPSAEFNSVFVTLHALQHLTDGFCLHHLCDIACVLKKADMSLVYSIGNEKFSAAVRAIVYICQKYLGSDVVVGDVDEELVSIFLQEIFEPKYQKGSMPDGKLSILCYKTRRFIYTVRLRSLVWGNSVAGAVWKSAVGHLKNPETIFMRGE